MKKLWYFVLFSLMLFSFSCNKTNYFITSDNNNNKNIDTTYCLIDIKGEINFPGMYSVEVGTTLYELVKLAGGFTTLADTSFLNLSTTLNNNQMIVVPKISNTSLITNTSLININTATLAELMQLPGIGNAKAVNILDYRNNNGYFNTIEDLKKVTGIGEEIFAKVKNYICV